MKIIIGTTSELKIRAAREAFRILNIDPEISTVKSDSEIPDQPFGIDQIITGAKNRAKNALVSNPADFSIGIENGIIHVEQLNKWMETLAVVVVASDGRISVGLGSAYPVPDWAVEIIEKENTELGKVIQKLNPDLEKDPINYFSDGTIKREETITQAVVSAMLEFVNSDKYKKPEKINKE